MWACNSAFGPVFEQIISQPCHLHKLIGIFLSINFTQLIIKMFKTYCIIHFHKHEDNHHRVLLFYRVSSLNFVDSPWNINITNICYKVTITYLRIKPNYVDTYIYSSTLSLWLYVKEFLCVCWVYLVVQPMLRVSGSLQPWRSMMEQSEDFTPESWMCPKKAVSLRRPCIGSGSWQDL